ncbi:MAG: hypothetical protein H6730_00505 [Deltaproteobacteria bacterium]|nr:hypothetical protein [Deltaproteobacteria bacterium]
MTTLKDIVSSDKRPAIVRDAVQLVDSEVHAKSGLSGMAIKAGYAAVKAIKPSLIQDAVENLLDKFVDKLEPFYARWLEGGKTGTFDAFLNGQKTAVANALLSVTDERARHVDNKTIRKTYEKLRPQGEKNVEAAVPGLGRVLQKYVG